MIWFDMIWHEWYYLTWFDMNDMIWHELTNNKTDSKMTDEGTVGAPTCLIVRNRGLFFCLTIWSLKRLCLRVRVYVSPVNIIGMGLRSDKYVMLPTLKHVFWSRFRYEFVSFTESYDDYLLAMGIPSLVLPLVKATAERITTDKNGNTIRWQFKTGLNAT
jgi:hypothetical protein